MILTEKYLVKAEKPYKLTAMPITSSTQTNRFFSEFSREILKMATTIFSKGHAYGLPPILTFSALQFSWNHSHYETTRQTVFGYQGGVDDNLQISLERRIKILRTIKLCLCSDLPCIPDHKSTYSFHISTISSP
uniref:Uncharacterized protein n=1 Tax=Glossina pallidipes TaxID=7398 RepID=A0A1B0AHX3_GLOPL